MTADLGVVDMGRSRCPDAERPCKRGSDSRRGGHGRRLMLRHVRRVGRRGDDFQFYETGSHAHQHVVIPTDLPPTSFP